MHQYYFLPCSTEEELKKRYWQLARKHHPDVGGDTETMAAINVQYEDAVASLGQIDQVEDFIDQVNDFFRSPMGIALLKLSAIWLTYYLLKNLLKTDG